MLEIGMGADGTWSIPVLKTIAESGSGVGEVFMAIKEHYAFLQRSGTLQLKNRGFARTAVMNIIRDVASERASEALSTKSGMALLDDVASRKLDPFKAAQKLFR